MSFQSSVTTCSSLFPFSAFQTILSELEDQGIGSRLHSPRGEKCLFHMSVGMRFCAVIGLPASLWLSRGFGLVLSQLEPRSRLWSAASIVLVNNPLNEQQFWFPVCSHKGRLICHCLVPYGSVAAMTPTAPSSRGPELSSPHSGGCHGPRSGLRISQYLIMPKA